jgi:hypothetical protein
MASIRYDHFEASFAALLAEGRLIHKLLDGEKKASMVDALTGRIVGVDRQIRKILDAIRGDDAPAKSLATLLKELEVEKDRLNEELELEKSAVMSVPAPELAYEELKAIFGRLDEDGRHKAKALIRDLVEKIIVRLGEDQYEVHLRGCAVPVAVTIIQRPLGWMFTPAPSWVLSNSKDWVNTHALART